VRCGAVRAVQGGAQCIEGERDGKEKVPRVELGEKLNE